MIVSGTNLSMIRGDSEVITVKVVDENQVHIPFEFGDTVYFTVREQLGNLTTTFQKTVTSFTDGEAVIEIDPDDTKSLYFRTYVYDVQWNKADGTVRTIVPASSLTILGEVTYD